MRERSKTSGARSCGMAAEAVSKIAAAILDLDKRTQRANKPIVYRF
jgi:hypothetical protein